MARGKSTKSVANYRYPKEATDQICDNCSMFIEPDGCTSVEGYIDRLAVCDYFEFADNQTKDRSQEFTASKYKTGGKGSIG